MVGERQQGRNFFKKEKRENWYLSWCKREALDSSYLYVTLFIMQDSLNLRSKERVKKKERQHAAIQDVGQKMKRSTTREHNSPTVRGHAVFWQTSIS